MNAEEEMGVSTSRERLRRVQERIVDLLFEIDTITLQMNPQIEADYATRIGCFENELLRCQLDARRAKRRLALAQARANAGVPFGADEFEARLDEEFAEWERRFQANMAAYLNAVEFRASRVAMSAFDGRKLARVHRELVKRLHPDTHPDQDERAKKLFLAAQSAYRAGDLALLRSLIVATEDLADEGDEALSEDELALALEIGLAHQKVLEERLAELKRSMPYRLKAKLEDPIWVEKRTSELRRQIEEQKRVAAAYHARFHSLLEEVSQR